MADLLNAISHRSYIEVLALLTAGRDVNYMSHNNETALYVASKTSCVEIVELLLLRGADVDGSDDRMVTPLMIAVFYGHKETVACLLKHGADPNKQSECGYTCLHFCKHTNIAELLLNAGADYTLTNINKVTAKDHARDYGWNKIANLIEQYEVPCIKEPDEAS